MNRSIKFLTVALTLAATPMFAQLENERSMQQFRYPDQRGINSFEALKDDGTPFDGVKVRLGGAFAIQFQGLTHSTGTTADTLMDLGQNFNLPTANLDLNVALADGVRMHMRTYLSARHHNEAWVKGGYVQVSKLDFIKKDLLKSVMDITTIKVGLMELNYGDYHFRRTDNATAIFNPFVGNLIMDGFTTEAGAEVYVTPGDLLFMVGVSNGKLNQGVNTPDKYSPVFLAKAGYDKQLNEDLRLRLTASLYTTSKSAGNYLYTADRAGSRFYLVMENQDANATSQFRSGRFNPGFSNEITAIMVNPFVKFKGLEFLGTFETSSGKATAELDSRTFTQIAADLLYRFGPTENFYVGGKYNTVSGKQAFTGNDLTINRIEAGAGWYMTKNMMLKAEYVTQS